MPLADVEDILAHNQDVIVIVPTTEIEGPYQDHFFAGAKVEYAFAGNVIHMFSKDEQGTNLEF